MLAHEDDDPAAADAELGHGSKVRNIFLYECCTCIDTIPGTTDRPLRRDTAAAWGLHSATEA